MRWVKATVLEKRQWTEDLYTLYLHAIIAPFEAGQFTYLAKDDEPKLFRPYSFVNSPDSKFLSFYFKRVGQGRFSTYLSQLEVGDHVKIAFHAKGRFTLSQVPDAKRLWCIASGTGLGVFISLLQSPAAWQRFEDVILIHSVSSQRALTYLTQIQKWQQDYPQQFYYIPIVTQGSFGGWNERITTLLANGSLESKLGLSLCAQDSHAMLCGDPGMVSEVVTLLEQRGCILHNSQKSGHISIEKYWK